MYVLARLWGHVTLHVTAGGFEPSHSSLKKQDPTEVNGAWGAGVKVEPIEMVNCG